MHISKIVLEQFTTLSLQDQNLSKNFSFNSHLTQKFQDPSMFHPLLASDNQNSFLHMGPTLPALMSQYISPSKPLQDCDLQTFGLMCKSLINSPKKKETQSLKGQRSFPNTHHKKMETEFDNSNIFTTSKNAKSKASTKEMPFLENADDDGISDFSQKNSKEGGKKYKTYSKEDKRTIVNYIHEHGVDKALEVFRTSDPKLTKRKLSLWQTNIDKKKNTKGKITNDIARDQGLTQWYHEFKEQYKRNPTRREIMDNALTLSKVPEFRASKGWVDKIIKRLNFEVTLIKVKSPESIVKKRRITPASETAVTSRKISMESEKEPFADIIPTIPVGQRIAFNEDLTMGSQSETENSDINAFFCFTTEQCQPKNFERNDMIFSFHNDNDFI